MFTSSSSTENCNGNQPDFNSSSSPSDSTVDDTHNGSISPPPPYSNNYPSKDKRYSKLNHSKHVYSNIHPVTQHSTNILIQYHNDSDKTKITNRSTPTPCPRSSIMPLQDKESSTNIVQSLSPAYANTFFSKSNHLPLHKFSPSVIQPYSYSCNDAFSSKPAEALNTQPNIKNHSYNNSSITHSRQQYQNPDSSTVEIRRSSTSDNCVSYAALDSKCQPSSDLTGPPSSSGYSASSILEIRPDNYRNRPPSAEIREMSRLTSMHGRLTNPNASSDDRLNAVQSRMSDVTHATSYDNRLLEVDGNGVEGSSYTLGSRHGPLEEQGAGQWQSTSTNPRAWNSLGRVAARQSQPVKHVSNFPLMKQ